MSSNKISLLFNAKMSSFEKINENFLKAKCYVMATGKNVNRSYFDKDNIDRAYPTLSFVPVIGHLMEDENGNHYLGGHDYGLDLSTLSLKSKCVPFGVAIPSENPIYEDIVEQDGTISTYLTTDVVLWISRYPDLAEAIYSDKTYFGQSMEIFYSKSEPLKEDVNYTNIIDFSFDALCMLGKSDDPRFNVEPCFPSASIVAETYSINKDEFSSLMNEMKEQLKFCLNKNNESIGGINLEEKNLVLQKYGKSIEDLDFSIEDMPLEEFETKMEELFGEKKEPIAFSVTYRQKRDALCNTLDPIIETDANGNYISETYFYLSDFDDEYMYVEKDLWTADNYESTNGRISYTFDEETMTATKTSDFELMYLTWLTADEKAQVDELRSTYEAMSAEYETYKTEHSYENSKFEELKQYQTDKVAEERKASEDALFESYANEIGETNEFTELKEKASEFSLDALEKECLCIVGRYARANKPEVKTTDDTVKPIKFSVNDDPDTTSKEPYGGLMKHYLNK